MSKISLDEVEINGQTYIKKGTESQPAEKLDGMDYVVVRGDRSGVFAGYLESKKEREVVLRQARRIWYWSGAASISQLAEDGTSEPENCKFPKAVNKIQILDVLEIINCTKTAQKSIESVKVWSN
jgi:hypothetical protein